MSTLRYQVNSSVNLPGHDGLDLCDSAATAISPEMTVRTEPASLMVKAMTKSMVEALKIPHFGYKDEIDMSQLVTLRKDLKQSCSDRGIKLSYMPFIVKACSMALLHFPILNSSLNTEVAFKRNF